MTRKTKHDIAKAVDDLTDDDRDDGDEIILVIGGRKWGMFTKKEYREEFSEEERESGFTVQCDQ